MGFKGALLGVAFIKICNFVFKYFNQKFDLDLGW